MKYSPASEFFYCLGYSSRQPLIGLKISRDRLKISKRTSKNLDLELTSSDRLNLKEVNMTIAEVGKQFGISPDTLRYYEKIGLIPPIKKNNSGIRDYGEADLKWIEFIKCMRSAGLTIEVLLEYVELFRQGEATNAARKDLLIEQRNQLAAKLEELKKTIDKLDYKIEGYENAISQKEKELLNTADLI
jgi:DNA-binding transcriptional MerR regulator